MMKKLRYFCTLLLMAVVSVAWADDATDVLNQSWTGMGTTYAEKTDLQGSASSAIYAVQCAGGNDAIQLRSSNNSGIVSTTSGGTVTKVTVTWNSNTVSGRKLNVYGSNSAYSAPSDLYGSNAGTLIGTIECGTSTELTISGNYTYIGLRSASSAMYLDEIKVTWSTGGGSGSTTYTVTYDGNGGEGTMTDSNSPYGENDEVTLLTNAFTAPEGKLWDSWEVKDADDNVITVTNGKFTMPANNVTVKAQWVDDPNAPQINWVLTNLADLTANDVFVIVGNNGSNYAMTNNNGTSNPPAATAVTVANNKITSTVAANIQWTISGNATDGYTSYPNGSTSTWLYCTNTNNGVRVGTNANKTFKVDGGYLKHGGTSRYVGVYESADWRCYTSSGGNIANQTFAFYKKVTGGVIPPIITADNVNIAYDATAGEIAYTIENGVEGGSVNATTDAEWISFGTSFNSPIAFSCEANQGTARTATVTLTYSYGNNETVTKNVTVTQAAAPVVYTTIPDLFAAATSTDADVTITFNNWVISAVKGNNAYLTDNQGNGLIIYASGGHGFQVNDVLSGTANCKLVKYQGSAELKDLTSVTAGLTVTAGGTVTEQSISIDQLTGVNTGALVHYDGLTFNGTDLVDGNNNTIKPYSTLYSYIFEDGKTYNVTGIYLQYNTTKGILPRGANDIEEVDGTEPANVTWDLSIDETATATEAEMSWTSDYATMLVEKAGATTNTNNYYPGTSEQSYTSTRFYKNSKLTIAPKTGYTITKVVFTATTTSYATALSTSTWTNATAAVNGTNVTVTPANGNLVMVATIGGVCGFTSVKVYYEESDVVVITIKEGFPATTFSCDKALDFTGVEGITAYIITNDEGAVTEVTKVPAGKGLYIEAANTSDTEQTFDVPVITDEEAAEAETTFAATKLIPTASDGSKIHSEQTVAYYAYGKPANKPAAFYKISTDPAKGLTQEAGKALLKIEVANASSAKEMIMVNSNVTAIEDVNRETITNNHYYTVDGKCVKGEPTQKGIYIVKGRKVVVK